MVKDNDKFDRIEQINKLLARELSKPDDPNDPTTLSGKANIRYEKDLLNWWEAEQHAHAAGMPANPNIKPPTMANLTAHTSDKVASLLADFQSQDWGGAAGAARDTQAPNRLPPNYKPRVIVMERNHLQHNQFLRQPVNRLRRCHLVQQQKLDRLPLLLLENLHTHDKIPKEGVMLMEQLPERDSESQNRCKLVKQLQK